MKVIESLTKKGSLYLPENISENLNQFDILFYVIFLVFSFIAGWFDIIWIGFCNFR